MAMVGALLVGASAGCASEYEGADLETGEPVAFAATPGYVGEAIDASMDEAYRFRVSMSFSMGPDSFDTEVAAGAADGVKRQTTTDFGELFGHTASFAREGLPPELVDADLAMEQVTDGEAIYIRAPFIATMADVAQSSGTFPDAGSRPGGALFEVLDQVGDGWARVDLGALGDVLPAEAQQAITGGQSTNPDAFLDMLRSTGKVEDLGTDEIDGVTVHGLAADVELSEMLEVQGVDPDPFEESLGDALPGATEVLDASELPMQVWVDDGNLIRRISFTLGGESFTDVAEDVAQEMGEPLSDDDLDELAGFRLSSTMDFTDYGDASISIEPPDGAVDITDDFVAVYDDLDGE
jgi:hypothetical protein